jgi:hypothetical protein
LKESFVSNFMAKSNLIEKHCDKLAERNRENGSKSNGPKTPAGKMATDVSKVTHGIRCELPVIPRIESAEEWHQHLSEIRESLSPDGGLEEAFVYRIALNLWRMGRAVRAEVAAVLERVTQAKLLRMDQENAVMVPRDEYEDRSLLYERRLSSMLIRDLHELQRLQALRAGRLVPPPVAVDVELSLPAQENLG